jgi:hypothetical protein
MLTSSLLPLTRRCCRNIPRNAAAFSLLLYLNDGFEGGATTFFADDPERGATPLCERDRLLPCGAVLVFPHGAHPGCHPGLLHEGSLVLTGEKLLIRTDILYTPAPPKARAAKPHAAAAPAVAAAVPEAVMDGAAEFEAALARALEEVCPSHAHLARGCVRRVDERGRADLESGVAAAVFWAAASAGRAGAQRGRGG